MSFFPTIESPLPGPYYIFLSFHRKYLLPITPLLARTSNSTIKSGPPHMQTSTPIHAYRISLFQVLPESSLPLQAALPLTMSETSEHFDPRKTLQKAKPPGHSHRNQEPELRDIKECPRAESLRRRGERKNCALYLKGACVFVV